MCTELNMSRDQVNGVRWWLVVYFDDDFFCISICSANCRFIMTMTMPPIDVVYVCGGCVDNASGIILRVCALLRDLAWVSCGGVSPLLLSVSVHMPYIPCKNV